MKESNKIVWWLLGIFSLGFMGIVGAWANTVNIELARHEVSITVLQTNYDYIKESLHRIEGKLGTNQ